MSKAQLLACILLVGAWHEANAQCSGRTVSAAAQRGARIGFVRADSARLGDLIGACWGDANLIRSSAAPGQAPASRIEIQALFPLVDSRWNSAIPVGGNDGALWAGRGLNTMVSAGVALRWRRLSLTLDPSITLSQNLPFPILPSPAAHRNMFASPWRSGGMSADLPLRFGSASYGRIDPGESELDYSRGYLSAGFASSTQWWGPGIRNALVMSNNAAGIPRFYIRTARPVANRLGQFEGLWFLGGLLESPFFDYDTRNDLRALSAGVVTWRIAVDTGLTIGGARGVYAAARRFGRVPGHFADVFTDWHRQSASAPTTHRSDQMYSLFGRWRFPAARLSVHAEWARLVPPASAREMLVAPQQHQGYLVGLEWADSTRVGTIRLQTEATMLEQTPVDRGRDVPEFYASHSVPQGYTQQGQVIGASIGPGASSQYLGADLFRASWRFTAFAERARYEETAYYRTISGFAGRAHDVGLSGGVAMANENRWVAWEASYTRTIRLNYLFQTVTPYFRGNQFDVRNNSVSLRVTPRIRALR